MTPRSYSRNTLMEFNSQMPTTSTKISITGLKSFIEAAPSLRPGFRFHRQFQTVDRGHRDTSAAFRGPHCNCIPILAVYKDLARGGEAGNRRADQADHTFAAGLHFIAPSARRDGQQ